MQAQRKKKERQTCSNVRHKQRYGTSHEWLPEQYAKKKEEKKKKKKKP